MQPAQSKRAWNVRPIAVAGLVALYAAAHATADNLLVNPGFELPPPTSGDDSIIAGWSVLDDGARAAFAARTGNRGFWHKAFLDSGGVEQTVDIVGGTPYLLGGWNRYEANFPQTTAIIRFGVTWLDSGGGQVGVDNFDISASTTTPSAAFGQISHTVNAPANSTQARVFFGFFNGSLVGGAQSAFTDDVFFDGAGTPPPPAPNDWIPTVSGDYNVVSNWFSGVVPNAVGAQANFNSANTVTRTVYTDTPVIVGGLKFANAASHVLTGAGSMTMDVASGNATIEVTAGNPKINLPLRLNDNTVATVAAGSTLTIADPLTYANGASLTKSGAGTLEIISTQTTLAPAALVVAAGSANLRMDSGIGTTVQAAGGRTTFFASQRIAGLSIANGAAVAVDGDGPVKVVKTASLSVAPGGKLDIGDNGLIIQGGAAVEAVRSLIVSGYAGGAYDGDGIQTSAPHTNHGIGYADAAQLSPAPTSFLGEGFTGPAVLVRYTLLGDTNLDGTVGFDDLLSLAQNYNLTTGRRWIHGDSNHDAAVNFDDLLALAQNYNSSLPSLEDLAAVGGSGFAEDWALALSLVPEPASLASLGVAAIALRRRR